MKKQFKLPVIFFLFSTAVILLSFNNCGEVNLLKPELVEPATLDTVTPTTAEPAFVPSTRPITTTWANRNGSVCESTTDRCDTSLFDANGNIIIQPSMALDFWLAPGQVGVIELPSYPNGRVETTNQPYWPRYSKTTISLSDTPGDFSGPCTMYTFSEDINIYPSASCPTPKYMNVKWEKNPGEAEAGCDLPYPAPYTPRCAVTVYFRN